MTGTRHAAMDRIELGSRGLAGLLGFTPGTPLPGRRRWTFDVAFPFHEGGVLLSFRAAEGRETFGLQIRPRDDGQPAWQRTRHLDLVTQITDRLAEPAILEALEPLAARLSVLDGPATVVVDAPPPGDPPPAARPLQLPAGQRAEATSPFEFGRVFVLDLATDCGHRCSFCSTRRKMSPLAPTPGADLPRLRAALERALASGYDVLRLSGLDPLAHPDRVEVVAHARDIGFRHVHVYSPALQMADPRARSALLDTMPGAYTFHVPVYGPDAATHEAVTGVDGSFERVVAALDGLVTDAGPEHLVVLTVVTRGNLSSMPRLRELTRRWRAPVQVFLPFPSTRAPDDAFFSVAATHEEMVGALAACDPPMGLTELLPCVRWRHQRATGAPTLSQGGFAPVTAPLGTLFEHADYRRLDDAGGNTFTIPVRRCPHLDTCALEALCPRSVYAAYAERFGLAELQPVERAALQAEAPGIAGLLRPDSRLGS